MIRNITTTIILLLYLQAGMSGQGLIIKQTRSSGVYKKGETISVTAYTGCCTGDSLLIKITKDNLQVLAKRSVMIESDSLLLYSGSFDEPCSVMVETWIKKEYSAVGFLVEPEQLEPGGKRPGDFDKFWKEEKKKLADLPWEVKSDKLGSDVTGSGYYCADIELNCTGPKPARGYFARPEGAGKGTLPAVLLVHAAGVKGSWCRSEPSNALKYARMGAICFDLNAHGMLDGQPDSYYDGLEKGELKMYFYQGLESRSDFYFRGMYLRLLRTIEYLARQPEWDGERLLVIGESQGGGQALAAAGLDKRVSAAVAIVPAMCDWLGPLAGHEGGWPQPLRTGLPEDMIKKTVPYFDDANILKGSKGILFVEIGLIDVTCPPVSVYSAINQSDGRKIIYPVPYREHHQPANNMTKTWEETVLRPREMFITDYLK
jgi:cephalosporin-C deacetylase